MGLWKIVQMIPTFRSLFWTHLGPTILWTKSLLDKSIEEREGASPTRDDRVNNRVSSAVHRNESYGFVCHTTPIQRLRQITRDRQFPMRKHWWKEIRPPYRVLNWISIFNRASFLKTKNERMGAIDLISFSQIPVCTYQKVFLVFKKSKRMKINLGRSRRRTFGSVEKFLNPVSTLSFWWNPTRLTYGSERLVEPDSYWCCIRMKLSMTLKKFQSITILDFPRTQLSMQSSP